MSGRSSYYYYTDQEEEEEEEEEEESSESSHHPPALPDLVASRFRIQGGIGSGSYSEVYLAIDELLSDQVAVKVEWQYAEKGDKLLGEAKFYEALGKSGDVPTVRWSGVQGEYNMMVMDLLGPSLDYFFKECGKFGLKTVCMLAPQIIDRLEFVHQRGILYRDIKPHNFLMGTGQSSSRVFIVDFGLAKRYIDDKGEHIKCSTKKKSGVTGTVRYSSINIHNGLDASRRDDLEATGYMLVHLLKGDLPWLGLKARSKRSKHKLIGRRKIETSDEDLCKDLPGEFCEYFRYCRSLSFDQRPDYDYLRGLINRVSAREGFQTDGHYDWTNMRHLPPPVLKSKKTKSKSQSQQAKTKHSERSRSRARGILTAC